MALTDIDTAFETHRVMFASDRSADEGRPVKLSEMKQGRLHLDSYGLPRENGNR